jgi:hypothetical protein
VGARTVEPLCQLPQWQEWLPKWTSSPLLIHLLNQNYSWASLPHFYLPNWVRLLASFMLLSASCSLHNHSISAWNQRLLTSTNLWCWALWCTFLVQLHLNESQSSFTTPRQIQRQIVVATFRVDRCCASMEYALDQMHFTWIECKLVPHLHRLLTCES